MNNQTARKAGLPASRFPTSSRGNRVSSILVVALIAVLALGIFSCNNSFGILASIQKETKQTGTDVFLAGTVKKVVGDGTTYFSQMAKIYTRHYTDAVGSDAWKVAGKSSFGITDPAVDYTCTGLVSGTFSGSPAIFAVLSQRVGGELIGVYATTDHGVIWTKMSDTGIPAGGFLQSVFFVKDTLFASVRKLVSGVNVYDLLYHDGSGFLSSGAAVTAVANPFFGGVWDGTNYRFAQAGAIYAGST
ncbi:MAG: hypothetical protein Q8O19_07650, partial [Rectinemataceae bacterium]|nr:hypothetical protein [Rectinemataceae bacterium]